MKEEILKLRKEGKTYNEIVNVLGCSKATISYHCGKGQKEKNRNRLNKHRKTAKAGFRIKYSRFLRYKVKNFKSGTRGGKSKISSFNYDEAYKKVSNNPKCYLTGQNIDLSNTRSYELDHIIPYSKGGKNTLSNMGLCIKEANRAKDNMLLKEFIELCKKICENNGYMVIVAE